MPRNGSGVYSKPAGTTAVPNTTIESAKYNDTIDDLVADANAARPITAGGTGASNSTSAANNLAVVSYASQTFSDSQKAIARSNIGADREVVYATKSANYTIVADDENSIIRVTASSTVSLPAAATAGSNWHITVMSYNANVIIDPDGSETINGAATLTLRSGTTARIICDGTQFFAILSGGLLVPSTTVGTVPGYTIHPTGYIEQWGVVNFIASSLQVITFPIAYPNAQMINYACMRTGGAVSRVVSTDSGSNSQMTVYLDTAATHSVAWRSIGY